MSSFSRPSTGNSRLEIEIRQRHAEYNRNSQRIRKTLKLEERKYNQNKRKLDSVQRGLLVLLGKEPYPGCTREDVLTEYNPPGFCYHRNGQPRVMPSLQESKTRKIVNYIEDQGHHHQGLKPDPAINVVSDTPLMAEVLSSPELVQILSELRNTSIIMSDPILFSQFTIALANSKTNPLTGFDGPMDYLKQYRKNLIQEFFDSLKMEAEMRLMMVPDDPLLSFFKEPKTYSSRRFGSSTSTNFQTVNHLGTNSDLHNDMTVEEWNQAVITSLEKAQQEEMKERQENILEMGDTRPEKEEEVVTKGVKRTKTEGGGPSVGFEHVKKMDTNNRKTSSDFHKDPTQLLFSSAFTEKKKMREKSAVGLAQSGPRVSFHPDTKDKFKRQSRRDFDNFVRHLIEKIKKLDDVGRRLLAFQKKRPSKHENVILPLLKLLKKQSLFSSLTDDDFLFYDIEGGRKGVHEMVAQQLPSTWHTAAGGQRFQLPSPARHGTSSSGVSIASNATTTGQKLGENDTRPSTALSENQDSIAANNKEEKDGEETPPTCIRCEQVSMKKVHCPACRDKVKKACQSLQKRDNICKLTKNAYSWIAPELAMWPWSVQREMSPSRSRPPSVGESAGNIDFMRQESKSKSIYLVPPPPEPEPISVGFLKGGRNTPRFPRSHILPPPPSQPSYGLFSSMQTNFQSQRYFTPVPSKVTKSGLATSNYARNASVASAIMRPKIAFSSKVPTEGVSLKSVTSVTKHTADSWTLKVSKMDIMRLRHELETENVKDKMAEFEEKYLNFL